MDRRGFLKGIFGGAAAATAAVLLPTVLDPERQLWVPGAKTFFLPAGDIKIRNVEVATLAETAAITGKNLLRITHHSPLLSSMARVADSLEWDERVVEQVALVSEKAFAEMGGRMFSDSRGTIDVHFDNGTIAYKVPATMPLAEIRAVANAAKAANDIKVGHRKATTPRLGYTWLEKPIDTLVNKDSSPLIRLAD